jgi:hypothetical protein
MGGRQVARWTFSIGLWSCLGAAVCGAGGCATSTDGSRLGKPIMEFPSPAQLALIESRPAAIPALNVGEISPAGWRLEAPPGIINPTEPFQPRTSFEAAFAADLGQARPSVHLTRALACVAREAGRFQLEAQGAPPGNLQQFIIAACGAVVPQVGMHWLSGPVPDNATDDDVLARWREKMKADMVAHLPDRATDAGFWYGRAHGRTIAIMAYAASRVRWKTLTAVADEQGNATFEGELLEASAYITGYSNQGRVGVAPCTIDPSVPRPRFRAVCHLDADDDVTWVQFLSAPPKRVLAAPFAQTLLRHTADQPLVFSPHPYMRPHPVATAQEFATTVVAGLNDVRLQAGLRPVQLAAAESARAMRLADHFWAATLARGTGNDESNEIALGLLAGWQMEGLIRDGRFTSMLTPHTRDVARWLDAALTSPISRAALLAPEIEAVSLGAVLFPQDQGLGAVVTGYRLYHGDDHSADVKQLYARLLAARKPLGLGMPMRLADMQEEMQSNLARLQTGEWQSKDALNASLDAAVRRFGAGMRGYVIETTSLDAFQIPEELVHRRDLYFEIGVSHYRAPGAAWGQLVILVIFAETNMTPVQET